MQAVSGITQPYLTPGNSNLDQVEITAASYTLSNADLGRCLIFNKATAQTVSAPVGLSKGFNCLLLRIGVGSVTVSAGTGATLSTNGSSAALPKFDALWISSYTTNTFSLAGGDIVTAQSTAVSIATTGNTDSYIVAPEAGRLANAIFTSAVTLAANDTNSFAWTITNLGLAAGGTAVMLLAGATNSTLLTGGTGITAFASRTLSLTATEADLLVVKGDILRVRYAVTGTLGGANTGAITSIGITR